MHFFTIIFLCQFSHPELSAFYHTFTWALPQISVNVHTLVEVYTSLRRTVITSTSAHVAVYMCSQVVFSRNHFSCLGFRLNFNFQKSTKDLYFQNWSIQAWSSVYVRFLKNCDKQQDDCMSFVSINNYALLVLDNSNNNLFPSFIIWAIVIYPISHN